MAQSATEIIVYDAEGEFRVFPPVIRLNAAGGGAGAEKLTVTNLTEDDLVLYTAPEVIDNNGKPTSESILAGDSITTNKVKSNGNGKKKIFSYQVVSPKTGK